MRKDQGRGGVRSSGGRGEVEGGGLWHRSGGGVVKWKRVGRVECR